MINLASPSAGKCWQVNWLRKQFSLQARIAHANYYVNALNVVFDKQSFMIFPFLTVFIDVNNVSFDNVVDV